MLQLKLPPDSAVNPPGLVPLPSTHDWAPRGGFAK